MTTDKLATRYAGFLGRVDAILDTRGDWRQSQDFSDFDWYIRFVAGMEPSLAVEDAVAAIPDNACAGWGCVDGPCADCYQPSNDAEDRYNRGGW